MSCCLSKFFFVGDLNICTHDFKTFSNQETSFASLGQILLGNPTVPINLPKYFGDLRSFQGKYNM